jgi:hypothetical protein
MNAVAACAGVESIAKRCAKVTTPAACSIIVLMRQVGFGRRTSFEGSMLHASRCGDFALHEYSEGCSRAVQYRMCSIWCVRATDEREGYGVRRHQSPVFRGEGLRRISQINEISAQNQRYAIYPKVLRGWPVLLL